MAGEPKFLRAGDTWTWTPTFCNYAAADGWQLQYVLNSKSVRFAFPGGSVTSDVAAGFTVNVTAAQTAAVAPGEYTIYAILTKGSQTFTLEIAGLTVLANIATASGAVDTRHPDEIILDNIKAMLAGTSSDAVRMYKIGDRELQRMSMKELEQKRGIYEVRVRQIKRDRGEKVPSSKVVVRFK
jgi:hypothetical protein